MITRFRQARRWVSASVLLSAVLVACSDNDATAPTEALRPETAGRLSEATPQYIPAYALEPIEVVGQSNSFVPCTATSTGCPTDNDRGYIYMNSNGTWVTQGGVGGNDVDQTAGGPMAWGACMMTVLGIPVSVSEVADQLRSFFDAQKEFDMYTRMLDTSSMDEQTRLMYQEFQYQAWQKVREQRAALGKAINVSYWSILGASIACSAALVLPTT